MAEHKLSGDVYFLKLREVGDTEWKTLVCLINKTITFGDTNIIDATTQCGPDSLPGAIAPHKIDFDGQHLFDEETGLKVSGQDLFPWKRDKTTLEWQMTPEDPIEGDELYEGTGFIASLAKTYDQNAIAAFAGSISVYGNPTQTIYSGS